MNFSAILAYSAALVSLGIGLFVLYRDPRALVHRLFAAGMLLLALEAVFTGFAFQAGSLKDARSWYHFKLLAASFLPGIWLLFSLSFARANYREFITRWKWVLAVSFLLPPALVLFFKGSLFAGSVLDGSGQFFFRIGGAGFGVYFLLLIGAVLILANLERTLRHASGYQRWQVKFMALGVGCIFGARIYTDSQVILYRALDPALDAAPLGALWVAGVLIGRSLGRAPSLNFGFYLSHSFLYNSLTILLVGIYLVAVGIVAKLVFLFKGEQNPALIVFLVLIAILGGAVLLLSDRLRLQRKRWISRHFHRPRYDYLQVWSRFTEQTASLTDMPVLCSRIVKDISKTLETLAVSIWLVDEQEEALDYGGSTLFTEKDAEKLRMRGESGKALIQVMRQQDKVLDLRDSKEDSVEDFRARHGEALIESQTLLLIPLNAAGRLVGVLTLGGKVSHEPYVFEDHELLKTIADQAAANVLNLKLGERLRQAKEMEAFQVMSAFFMHDLKNLASRLSLLTQNLPMHFNDPDFRKDALRAISHSLEKIYRMCGRLSLLSQKLEILPAEIDLNSLVQNTLGAMDGLLKAKPVSELNPLPRIKADAEQLQKVLTNLLLNANEAIETGGSIRVVTEQRGTLAAISVIDDGCGISPEFMERSLFRPFQTTKKNGSGIGLFHSRKIVEAHRGRIEVESEKGKGSTFRVLLPLAEK